MDFKGKVVLITGASAGIGAATAIHFSKLSADLVLVGRKEEHLLEIANVCAKNTRVRVVSLVADISSENDVARIVKKVKDNFGKLDVLILNAAIYISDTVLNATLENFDKQMSVNFRGNFNLTISFIPLLIETKGNIIAISGSETIKPGKDIFTESLSKVAVNYMMRCVAVELGSKKVRANTLALGLVGETKIIDRAGLKMEDFAKEWMSSVPLGEIIKPPEVAEMISFLASDLAKHITGQTINFDGGLSAV